jgi:hypothetical protein
VKDSPINWWRTFEQEQQMRVKSSNQVVSAALVAMITLGSTAFAQRDSQRGFTPGSTHIGPRVWVGNLDGSVAFGGQIERAFTKPGEYGLGIIAGGLGVDYYHWSYRYRLSGDDVGYDYTVVPIELFGNYHFVIKDSPKIDPYVGLALVYENYTAKDVSSFHQTASAQGSASEFVAQVGARYFVTSTMAFNAQAGLGYGSLGIGLSWKY